METDAETYSKTLGLAAGIQLKREMDWMSQVVKVITRKSTEMTYMGL